jgi:Putative lumazine-binding
MATGSILGAMKTLLLRKSLLFAAGTLAFGLAVPSIQAAEPTPQEAPVLVPIHAMFDGMTARDAAAVKASALPGTVLVLMRDGKPARMTIEAFADYIAKPAPTHIEERISDPLVRIDHDLAVVWAPFEFRSDGKPDHCGTDLFALVRSDGKWLIAGIADTGSKECAAK